MKALTRGDATIYVNGDLTKNVCDLQHFLLQKLIAKPEFLNIFLAIFRPQCKEL